MGNDSKSAHCHLELKRAGLSIAVKLDKKPKEEAVSSAT